MRLRLYGGAVILLTPDAACCLTSPVCARVRSLAQSEPLLPAHTMEKAIPVCDAAVYRSHVGANTPPQALGGLESPTHDHLLARVLQLVSQHQFRRSRPRTDRGRFSTTAPAARVRADDSRSRPCPRPALNTAASAPSCAAVWSIGTGTRRRLAARNVSHGARQPPAAHGNDTKRPGGPGAERLAGMTRPAPVAARSSSEFVSDGIVGGEGRGDRPEGGGVSTSRDRNRGSLAVVRELLPAGDRVPTPLNGRVRGQFRGADQTRARARDR